MSLVTLKRKSESRYNNVSVGKQQFSLNGTHRSQGWVGQGVRGRTLVRSLAKGNTLRGHGGCCGTYPQPNVFPTDIETTENNDYVKKSVLNYNGMMHTVNPWIWRPAPITSVKNDCNHGALNESGAYTTHLTQGTLKNGVKGKEQQGAIDQSLYIMNIDSQYFSCADFTYYTTNCGTFSPLSPSEPVPPPPEPLYQVFLIGDHIALCLNYSGNLGNYYPNDSGVDVYTIFNEEGEYVNTTNNYCLVCSPGLITDNTSNIDVIGPGTPYNSWSVAYNGDTNVYNSFFENFDISLNTVLTNNSVGDLFSATWRGDNGIIQVEITYSFYKTDTEVKIDFTITNISGSTLTDVRFLYGFDPDIYVYETTNTVVNQYPIDGVSKITAECILPGDNNSYNKLTIYSYNSNSICDFNGNFSVIDALHTPFDITPGDWTFDAPHTDGDSATQDKSIYMMNGGNISLLSSGSVSFTYYIAFSDPSA